MINVIFLMLMVVAAHAASNTETCDRRGFRKAGCFKRNSKLLTDLLITDIDPTHEKWGTRIDWSNYRASIHSIACRCWEKALKDYSYFAIGYYGECWAGKDTEALEDKIRNPREHASYACVNGDHDTCDDKSNEECIGVEDNEYIYEISSLPLENKFQNRSEKKKTKTVGGQHSPPSTPLKPPPVQSRSENKKTKTVNGQHSPPSTRLKPPPGLPLKNKVQNRSKKKKTETVDGQHSHLSTPLKPLPGLSLKNIVQNRSEKNKAKAVDGQQSTSAPLKPPPGLPLENKVQNRSEKKKTKTVDGQHSPPSTPLKPPPAVKWRGDRRCGYRYHLPTGTKAECNPTGRHPCCSPNGWCGNTRHHCACSRCTDYRKKYAVKWRRDRRCGYRYNLPNGKPAECNPTGRYPCCSHNGWCGNTRNHCTCRSCIDYRVKYG